MLRHIDQGDFLKNHVLTNLKTHPNGAYGLYIDHTLDYDENLYQKRIFLLNLETMASQALQMGIIPDDYYFYGDHIVFKVVAGSQTTLYSYEVASEELVRICELPFVIIDAGFSDRIYFTAYIENDDMLNGVLSSDRSPFFQEGIGFVGKKIKGLFASDYKGREIRVLTHMDMDINLIDFDFLNNRIAFTAFESSVVKPVTSSVFVFDTTEDDLHKLSKSKYRIDSLRSLDSETLVFTAVDLLESNRNDNQQVYGVNVTTDKIHRIGENVDRSNERPAITTDALFFKGSVDQTLEGKYYHLRLDGHCQVLVSVDLTGDMTTVDTGLTMVSNFCVLQDKIILIGLKDQQLSELYCYCNGELTQITHHNDWLEGYTISRPTPLTVQVDNIDVKGWVWPPTKADSSVDAPGILMIHGGPKMAYSDVFSFDVQVLCAKGYYVFYANPMGSDGRGNAYADIRTSFAELPYMQLMAFTNEVLKKYPMIDGDRLGVTGGSYGGYMTNYIITKTDRFRVAISERGISNMVTMLTSSDIGYAFAPEYVTNQHNPWLYLDKYSALSPIMAVKNIKTPTLFNHGLVDYRCHYTESLNMHSALCQLGIPSRLCLYEEENHGLVVHGKPKSKYRRFIENVSWFNKYLKRG